MKKSVAWTLDNTFMYNTGKEEAWWTMAPPGPGMKYFNCHVEGKDGTFPCIEANSTANQQAMASGTTKMTLKDSDGYSAALVKAGISPEWVHLGTHTAYKDQTETRASRRWQYDFAGYPIEVKNMAIPNLKNIVTKALPNIPTLRTETQATLIDIMLGNWGNGTASDAAYAYSTPVFMLLEAVDSMAQAKALGQKEEEAEEEARTNFIVMIVSAILLFVPIIGQEVAAAAGLTSLARGIALASEVGNGALTIYDSVNDPSSAVINILGMLVGVGGIAKVPRDAPSLTKVAEVQRTMDPAAVGKFGKVFKNDFDQFKPVIKFCKWS